MLVAPRAGAWIEILQPIILHYYDIVAPRAGAWIEMTKLGATLSRLATSHPVRVRGLKSPPANDVRSRHRVAPRAGAWIEMTLGLCPADDLKRRTPCGCVD